MDGKIRFCLLLALASIAIPSQAAVVELSGMVGYSKSAFADGYKSMQRRYSGSLGFKFTPVSALEFEYTDSVTKVSYPTNVGSILPYYTTTNITYRDKIYSFNWVQSLVPAKWILQPYVVIGGGKMIRHYTQDYPALGYRDSASQSQTTGVGGAGLRIFLLRNMALKMELKTYVPKFRFSKWKENQMYSAGLSWAF